MVEWRNNSKIGIVLVVIIVILLAITYQRMKPKESKGGNPLVNFKCEQCDNIFNARTYAGQKFPIKCPKCGKAAAYKAAKCGDCGTIFTIKQPVLSKGPLVLRVPKCPKCGSINLVPVIPREPLPESK